MRIALSVVLAAQMCLPAVPAHSAEGTGLTEQQSLKYREATKLRDETERPFLDRQRAGLEKVRALIAAGKSDQEIQRELDGLKVVFDQIQAIEGRYENTLTSFLTPLMRAKLAADAAAAPKMTVAPKAAAEARDTASNVPGDEEEQE